MVLYTKRNRRIYYFIRRTFLSGKGNLNFPLSSLTLQLRQIMVATKYGHVIGLCPYFSSGCFKLNISIIEGAHPKLQAIEFTKENIRWCCGDESQTKFGGFAFFPGKALSKRFLHNVGQRVNNGLKIVVCLGKNVNGSKHYQELRRQNIVMGDVEYYRKMITPTRNSGSKNSIVL
jgi:hypothetical protein